MRLTDILQLGCVKVPLEADTKQQVIYELADLLAEQAGIRDVETLKNAVWQREQTRTTGIGHGVGIPHGKCADCKQLRMAVGVTARPIDFGAIDGEPVALIILLASPVDQTGPHIQALARISHMLTDETLRENLKQATTAEALYQQIAEHEAEG